MSRLDDFHVIRASDGTPSSMLRRDIRPGDIVFRKGTKDYRQVTTQDQMRAFYRALGIELWSDWRWIG